MRVLRTLFAIAVGWLLAGPLLAQVPQGLPASSAPLGGTHAGKAATAAAKPGAFREIKWDELVPPNWDPMKDLKSADLGRMNDADPRVLEMMKKLREVWDNAPSNPALDGQSVRIPGFVVPLEEGKEGLTEFLLVPYFGACIHSPPPPSNQIIHVLPASPAKGFRSMDTVWISGTLVRERGDTYMGASGYRMQAQRVQPYEESARK